MQIHYLEIVTKEYLLTPSGSALTAFALPQ